MGASWIINRVLGHPALPPPHDVAFLLTLFIVLLIPAFALFIAVREPPGAAESESVMLREQLRRAGQLLRRDPVYRRYTAAWLLLSLTGVVLPFYSVYAKDALGAEAGMAGVYAAASTGAKLLSNLVFGWISDRRGNQLVMRLLAAGKAGTAFLALALVGFVSISKPQGAWLPYLALPLFFLDGGLFPAGILSGSNFVIELAPENERAMYIGLSNTLNGTVTLLSVLGGLLVDLLGFAGLFATGLMLCLAAYVLATGLPEPRETACD